jgi:hypothetical protein
MAVRFPAGAKIFLFATAFSLAMGFVSLLSNGTGTISSGLKEPERNSNSSPPCNAEGQERLELYLHKNGKIHSGLCGIPSVLSRDVICPPVVSFPAVQEFSLSTASEPTLGPTQPPIQWVPGPSSLGKKRQGREADHSTLS